MRVYSQSAGHTKNTNGHPEPLSSKAKKLQTFAILRKKREDVKTWHLDTHNRFGNKAVSRCTHRNRAKISFDSSSWSIIFDTHRSPEQAETPHHS
jgi:hypothetical protein